MPVMRGALAKACLRLAERYFGRSARPWAVPAGAGSRVSAAPLPFVCGLAVRLFRPPAEGSRNVVSRKAVRLFGCSAARLLSHRGGEAVVKSAPPAGGHPHLSVDGDLSTARGGGSLPGVRCRPSVVALAAFRRNAARALLALTAASGGAYAAPTADTSEGAMPASGFTQCATQYGACAIPTDKAYRIYFGVLGAATLYYRDPAGGISVACTTAVFGDPAPGNGSKACFLGERPSPTPDGGGLTFSDSQALNLLVWGFVFVLFVFGYAVGRMR